MLKSLVIFATALAMAQTPVLTTRKVHDKPVANITSRGSLPVAWHWYEKVAWGANLALALVGIGGIWVAVLTLTKIERQTKAAEDAATASLKQANHIVATERPFLMIEASGFELVQFRVVNRGKSPAQIIFYNNFPNLDTPFIGDEWNPVRSYGFGYDVEGMEIINVQWLAPGDPPMIVGTYTLSVLKECDPDRWDAIKNMRRLMYLWSSVKYRGLSGPTIYESRYCYMVTSQGPVMAGPPGLNSYT